jgi:hypothetical protein
MAARPKPPLEADFSVRQVALRKRVDPRKVLGWIESGELVATDVGNGKYRQLRISAAAFADFERRRVVGGKAKAKASSSSPAPRRRSCRVGAIPDGPF